MPAEVAINEAVVLAKRYATEEAARLVNGILGRITAGGGRARMSADESLQRAEELLERLRTRVDALEASADTGGDVDEAVDGLAEIAEIAREIERELQRARQAADAGA